MDYKKKYKKVLARAREAKKKTESAVTIGILEDIFPELRESEDEKIRKEILSFCQGRADNYPNAPMYGNIRKWISWLEKQGQRPQSHWKPSDKQMDILLSEVNAWTKGCPKQVVLESIYNDLKKLKEK